MIGKNTNTTETTLNYDVTEQYTWTAPADIEFTTGTNGSEIKSGTVEVTENIIPDNKVLKISIKSDQILELSDVANPDNRRAYTVKKGDTVINAGSPVLKVKSGVNNGSADLDFQMVAEATEVSGNYAGTLCFVADITDDGIVADGTNIMMANDADGNGVVSKGDTLKFATSYMYADENSTAPTEFRVLKVENNIATLMSRSNYQYSRYNDASVTVQNVNGYTVQKYSGSTLDNLMNETYYNSLSEGFKRTVVPKQIDFGSYCYSSNGIGNGYYRGYEGFISGYEYHTGIMGKVETITRNVYIIDVSEIVEYLGEGFTPSQINDLFFNTGWQIQRFAWTRSPSTSATENIVRIDGRLGHIGHSSYGGGGLDVGVVETQPVLNVRFE